MEWIATCSAGRETYEKLRRQHARVASFGSWLDANPDDAGTVAERDGRASARYGELATELATWAGVEDARVWRLLMKTQGRA